MPVPPLEGWHSWGAGLSAETRARVATLGWMPVLVLYLTMSYPGPVVDAYWALVDGVSALFRVPEIPAWYGRMMLSLAEPW